MRKRIFLLVLALILVILTAGCLYPEERRMENMGPPEVHLEAVKQAVDRYVQETGVLPIITSKADTPVYEKYAIDFGKLFDRYIGYIPPNAFEKGGPFRYVIIDPEGKREIKLLDLRISSQVGKVQLRVDQYILEKGQLPVKEKKPDSKLHPIDYGKLGIEAPEIESPFTGQILPLLLREDGKVFVDYALDIGVFLHQKSLSFSGADAREVLVENSPFVPVKSLPYKLQNGDIVIQSDE